MAAGSAAALAKKVKVADLEVGGRRVLLRADLNLPVRDGTVTDDTRLLATLPTLHWLRDRGAAVAVISHRGRPKGRRDPAFGMQPVAEALARCIGDEVRLLPDCVGDEIEGHVARLAPGCVALLENVRFHAAETTNDPEFARGLGALAPIFVNDAFGVAHRAHASVVGVAAVVEAAACGFLLQREVEMLSRVLDAPERPFVLVLGGAKVSDKLAVVGNLVPLVDRLVVGGAMANSLLAAQGKDMGDSRLEGGSAELARRLIEQATEHGVELLLPEDFVVAPGSDRPAEARVAQEVGAGSMALDIGPSTRERFAAALEGARTVLWNGPMGVFEVDEFSAGTYALGKAIAGLGPEAFTVLGGGDTAAAAAAAGITDQMTHVSTGGGASLDLLSGHVLPGVAALTDRSQ